MPPAGIYPKGFCASCSLNGCVCVCVCFVHRLYENKGESDFMESVRNLFTSFSIMMNSDAESTSMVKVHELKVTF